MRLAKIRFTTDEAAGKALLELAKRTKITVLRDESFIVPEAALSWLKSEGLSYEFLNWMHQDHVVETLRDNLAHPV